MRKVDYLIVGQGLAGTFLAYQLIQRGFSIMVIDKGHKYSSSFVAAGIINPIVLRRFTVTWRAKEFLQYNDKFYNDLENYLGSQYHFKMPIEKLISSDDEALFWQNRYNKEGVSDYISEKLYLAKSPYYASDKFKVGRTKQTSWLDISRLLTDFRNKLQIENKLTEESINYQELSNNSYKNLIFNKIVFCEGANGKKNPFFGNLPFSLNKGQLITISNTELPIDKIIKKKVFVLPINNNEFKIGATYSWKWDNSTEKTAHKVEKSKTQQLQSFLEEITASDYKIIKEETGIRPSIKDRRPLIGKHAVHSNYYIFNGMGTRGCFMAPLLSKEFIDYSEDNIKLHPEVELNRFNC